MLRAASDSPPGIPKWAQKQSWGGVIVDVTSHSSGAFNWVDLQTSDLDAAKKYYGALFGWTLEDQPIPDGSVYVMAKVRGKAVAGMSMLPPGQDGVPPHWNTYISVDDVDAATARAASLGGRVIFPVVDVMGFGRMSVVSDPEGAVFSLWQAQLHIGAELVGETGTFCWNELYTRNLAGAIAFYGGLFGWTMEQGHAPFIHVISLDGREIGTVLQIQPEWGPIPPHWAVYFAVEHCERWLAESDKLGGHTFVPPQDIPGVGRFAGVADPEGARFQVIQLMEHAAGA
jgi:hypothetical protein